MGAMVRARARCRRRRGLAHIAVFEALDELGSRSPSRVIDRGTRRRRPAGMTGKALRHHVLGLAHDPTEVWRRWWSAPAGDRFSSAMRLDPQKLCEQFRPTPYRAEFGGLGFPLSVIASDLYGGARWVYSTGPLSPRSPRRSRSTICARW